MHTPKQTSKRCEASTRLSYPTVRLLLGIVYVGSIVLAAIALLVVDLSGNVVLRTWDARYGMFTGVGLLVAIVTLLALPFDLIGGYLLPKAFGRDVPTFPRFVVGLLKGTFNHAGYLWLAGSGYLLAATLGGWALIPVVAAVLIGLQIVFQQTIARLVGNLGESSSASEEPGGLPISELSSRETSFSGGIVGWPGLDRIVVAGNLKHLGPRLYELFVKRRVVAVELGLRRRGVVLALLWNLAGVIGAAYFSGLSGETLAELIDFACLGTLWSFVGLLILPSLTRNAVAAIDRQMLAMGYARKDLEELARATCDWQDGENERSQAVETIFHPQPSLKNRMDSLEDATSMWSAWNAARMTLYLSWSGLGLLSRAVHSNAGRPDLWAMGAVD